MSRGSTCNLSVGRTLRVFLRQENQNKISYVGGFSVKIRIFTRLYDDVLGIVRKIYFFYLQKNS